MKQTALTLLLIFASTFLLAQKAEKKAEKQQKRAEKTEKRIEKKEIRQQGNRYFRLGGGASNNYTVDTRMAQNHYQGFGAYAFLGYQTERKKGFYDMQLGGLTYHSLSAAHGESSMDNFRYDFRFRYLRNVSQIGDNWHFRLGGTADFTYNSRLHFTLSNDGFAHDMIGSLGIATSLSRDLHFFKRDWTFRAEAGLPLFAYVNRLPEYSLSGWGGTSHAVKPIGLYNRLNTSFSLFKPFHKHTDNGFLLSYSWDFYGFNDSDIHQVRTGTQQVGLAILMKI